MLTLRTVALHLRIAGFCAAIGGVGCAHRPPPGATLAIKVPAGDDDAELWVDGNYVGQVREVMAAQPPLRLAPGRHRVEIRKAGRFPAQRSVAVGKDDSVTTVETTLPVLDAND